MSYSDLKFAYGPFAPHYVPRQYVENYFSFNKTDEYLVLSTTVEDVSKLPPRIEGGDAQWKLTLRKYYSARHVDIWWEEVFDAVILANGHYSVPYVRTFPLVIPSLEFGTRGRIKIFGLSTKPNEIYD